MTRSARNVVRAAAAGALLGASLLFPAPAAQASAWDCRTVPIVPDGGRAWCNKFDNQGTRIRSFVECEKGGGAFYETVYGPWVSIAGAYSDAYCPLGYNRYYYYMQWD